MITLVLAEIVEAIEGHSIGKVPAASVRGVSIDSRTIKPGDLFFAIPGPRFDGHDFVAAALEKGAVAAVISAGRGRAMLDAANSNGKEMRPGALIEVSDPVAALGRLAAFHRGLISASVIAVVGSNGKTTTKAMIDHILSARRRGRASPKSFNNALGVPLTLLSVESQDEYVVVEIGTNATGEIASLAELARPNLAVLTTIAEEHLEGLGDLAGVAAEECAIFAKLESGAFAAVNGDCPLVAPHLPTNGVTVATFGSNDKADLRVSAVRFDAPWLHFTLNERFQYRLPMAGAHNAMNAAGAITIARRFGMDHDEIAGRLASFAPPPMRNELLEIDGVTILNDAYNANPDSVAAAIDALQSLPCKGRRLVVFGEMRELGEHSPALHLKVAEIFKQARIDRVLLVGPATAEMAAVMGDGSLFGPTVEHCDDLDACVVRLRAVLQPGDVVLLKASRAVGLERLVELLSAGQSTPSVT